MNRPFAYVCSPYAGETKLNASKARIYSRKLYELGYLPVAPHLLFPQFLNEAIPEERRNGLDMAKDILRRCRVLVVCGKEISEGMSDEIALARRLGIVVTTMEGVERPGEFRQDPAEAGD